MKTSSAWRKSSKVRTVSTTSIPAARRFVMWRWRVMPLRKVPLGMGVKHRAIATMKTFAVAAFGDVAHRVGHERVVVALSHGLGQHAGVVGIEAPGLGVADIVGHDRAVELRRGEADGGLGRGDRHLFEADAESCGRLGGMMP
jgi:hypothetical protein